MKKIDAMAPPRSGFTLIELILAISISLILLWQGLVRYNEFNRKQQVKQAALDFVSVLRDAQNKAVTGDKTCAGDLVGFRVARGGANTYTVAEICVGGGGRSINGSLKSSLVSISGSSGVTFDSVYGTASGAPADFLITHSTPGVDSARITVSAGGDISCTGCD